MNKEERKHLKDKASSIYGLYYAMLKLAKSCQVLNVTKEMVFRGADKKMAKHIAATDFEQHLKEVFSIDSVI